MEFLFDLQRFAEGDSGNGTMAGSTTAGSAPASGVESQTTATQPTSTTPTPGASSGGDNGSSAAQQQPAEQKESIGLVTDPRTGRKRIVVGPLQQGTAESEGEPSPVPQSPQETPEGEAAPPTPSVPEPQPPKPAEGLVQTEPYTLDQLNQAIQMGNVDERRIPREYVMQYFQYRQQQAQQQAAMQAQQTKMQQEQQKAQVAQQQQLLAQINEAAQQQALQELGLKKEDLDLAEYSDDDALKNKVNQYRMNVEWTRQQIMLALQAQQLQEQQRVNAQQEIYKGITDFVTQRKQEEPHFDEINQLMTTRYQTMPFAEAQAVSDAIQALNSGRINEAQCRVLEKYYEDTRVAYYAKINDLSKTPKKIPVPKVEQPGTGATEPPKAFDFGSLKNMSVRERRAALARYWKQGN